MNDLTSYQVEKAIWTDADLEVMGWHDSSLHAIAFEPSGDSWSSRLLADLDYIVGQVAPDAGAGQSYFSFWICPSTIVFHDASGLRGNLQPAGPGGGTFDLEINAVLRTPNPRGRPTWTLEGHNFDIGFEAGGFIQYLRLPPILGEPGRQRLTLEQRGGLSFAECGFEPG
jgi:hypothetical protein